MKKQVIVLLAGFVLGAGTFVQAHAATTICNGTAGAAPGKLTSAADGSVFLQQEMKFKCSGNVIMSADQDTSKAWAAAASKKGKFYWGGNTDGGSAQKLGTTEVVSGTDPTPDSVLDTAKTAGSGT
jgi:hypothetical protein